MAPEGAFGRTEADVHADEFWDRHGFDGSHIFLGGALPNQGVLRLLERADAEGKWIHLWLYGKPDQGDAPEDPNDAAAHAHQRMVLALLEPYSNWSMGLGYDLQLWVDEQMLADWVLFMESQAPGHLFGGRALIDTAYDGGFASFEQQVIDKDEFDLHLLEAIRNAGDRPVGSFDRFRSRSGFSSKDWTQEEIAIGISIARDLNVACIWANLLPHGDHTPGSQPFDNLNEIRAANGLPPLTEEEEDNDMASGKTNTWHWERNKREAVWTLPADDLRDMWGPSWRTNPETGQPWGSWVGPWMLFTPKYPWEFSEVASFIGLDGGVISDSGQLLEHRAQEVGLAVEITDQFRGDPDADPSTWQPINGKNIWSRALEQHGGTTSQEAERTDYFPKGRVLTTPFAARLWAWYTVPKDFGFGAQIAIVVRLRGHVRWDLEDAEPDGRTLFPLDTAAEEMEEQGAEPYYFPCPKREPSK